MNKVFFSIFAFIIIIIVTAVMFNRNQNQTQTQEPFTAKINQMWRPHYRHLTTYTNDTINTSVGNIKRTLRQTGLL